MSQPITTEELTRLREHCRYSTGVERRPFRILSELIDARAEIARLQGLSSSQAEALDASRESK